MGEKAVIFGLLFWFISSFPAASELSRAKELYYCGRIADSYRILVEMENSGYGLEAGAFFASVLSELGEYARANKILLNLDPIANKSIIGVVFLKNLLRWKRFDLARMYLKELETDDRFFFEVKGDILFYTGDFRGAIKAYKRSVEKGAPEDYALYKTAKAYYKSGNRKAAREAVLKALEIAKSRILIFNLRGFLKIL